MAKLSSYRRLFEQDFAPDDQALISKLATTVNASFEEIYGVLNGKITLRDNISCTFAEFKVTVDSTGTPANRTQFKLNASQTTVEGLIAVNVVGANDPSLLPTGGVFVSYARNDNSIVIQNIQGLQADKPYKVKVLVLG
jgi:hypothetical protein